MPIRVYDKDRRGQIRADLMAYATAQRIGSDTLASLISGANPGNPEVDPRRLRRWFSKENTPKQDEFYGWCDLFLRTIGSVYTQAQDLAMSLIAFFGVVSTPLPDGVIEMHFTGAGLHPNKFSLEFMPFDGYRTFVLRPQARSVRIFEGVLVANTSRELFGVCKDRLMRRGATISLSLALGGPTGSILFSESRQSFSFEGVK